jgi:hypothetical protein
VNQKENDAFRPKTTGLSEKAIDAMINQYASKLHNAISTITSPYSTGGLGYATGSLVNLTA